MIKKPLAEIATFIRGITFKPEEKCDPFGPQAVACMRTSNVQAELDQSDLIGVPRSLVKNDAKILRSGDILVSSANSWNLVGKCCWVPDLKYEATAGGFISILRGDRSLILPRYLFHWFSSAEVQNTVRSFGNQTTNISNLNHNRCLELAVPLPPLAEQKRIAAILDAADELRTKRRESLAQLDTLLQSTFLDLFGDPEGKGWQMATVEDVADDQKGSVRTGPFGSQMLTSEFADSGIAVLGIDNAVRNEFQWGERRFITPAKYRQLERYTVQPGDVLITIMGTCGRCAIVPEDIPTAINTKHLCCITLNRKKCLPTFLHSYFLLHPVARQYLAQTAKGAIMSGLNMGIIKAMPIPIAPLSLQKGYSELVSAVEQQKQLYRAQFDELNNLFASLQSRAFRGEL